MFVFLPEELLCRPTLFLNQNIYCACSKEPAQWDRSLDHPKQILQLFPISPILRERRGSVVECLTRDREVAGSSLTGVTVLWSLSKTHLS